MTLAKRNTLSISSSLGTLPNTTTVVMKAHESLDERFGCAHVVGNGCDGPRVASCVGTATKPVAPRANVRVTAAQSPTGGALPARSSQQAHQLRSFFFPAHLP